jgi:hypothetical protein
MIDKITQAPGKAIAALLGSQSRLSYRRLLVFGVACMFVTKDIIPADAWLMVAVAYIGGDAIVRAASAFRK